MTDSQEVKEMQAAARFRAGVARASAKWGTERAVTDQQMAADLYAKARSAYASLPRARR